MPGVAPAGAAAAAAVAPAEGPTQAVIAGPIAQLLESNFTILNEVRLLVRVLTMGAVLFTPNATLPELTAGMPGHTRVRRTGRLAWPPNEKRASVRQACLNEAHLS